MRVMAISLLLTGSVTAAEIAPDPDSALAAHNRWRQQVDVAPLAWSAELARSARDWAAELAERGCPLEHGNSDYGENLYLGWSSDAAPDQPVTTAVTAWAGERKFYDYASNRCAAGEQCGHYTQIIWADSKRVGCASARCTAEHRQIWVCRYDPPGNWVGEQPY